MRVRLLRCPHCGSTSARWDETRSAYEFTWMQCDDCGEGGLCDSWQRDFDWYLEVELAEGEPLPARVAPLAPGEWLYDPTPSRGCPRCAGADAEVAWEAIRTQQLRVLADESHFGIQVTACGCGQEFAIVFTERIDWAGGDDDQTWLALPLEPGEHATLAATPVAALESTLTRLGRGRRFLVRAFATGGAREARWCADGFAIGPHD